LAKVAEALKACARHRSDLPALFGFSDPIRAPSVERLAAKLPWGAGIVVRHFGRPDFDDICRGIRCAHDKEIIVLIAGDAELAIASGADGVHIPERMASDRALFDRRFGYVTASCHGLAGLRKLEGLPIDGLFLSSVFPSGSPSAKRPIGPHRLTRLVERSALPVLALGGVNHTTCGRLVGSGCAGFAVIGALRAP